MMKFSRVILINLILIATLLLCSCNVRNEKKEDEKLNIITSFYPMYVATANIIDEVPNVTLECLASPEVGCLHDYQLTVKDMMKLENADIFIINGGGMEAFLDKAISAYPDLEVINASEHVLENHEHEHESEGEEHGHNHEDEENPHIWVSIDLHIHQIEEITEKLGVIDSGNKEKYEENAQKYIFKLQELSERMHTAIDNLPNKNIVTFHEAFYYFAKEFDLNVMAVIEREPGTSPSARDIAEIIDIVKENDVNAIFVEPEYLKTAANVIANETNVNVYELDPVTSGAFKKEAYIDIMNQNLEVLKEALK
ncbi:MAG: zinc ABC transporter substrate-binding protein [Clostridia bacterium]|nr:zinc ABC transporter substrate-binding protein [Clostridia bacterium]